jgi:uncharacterized protein (TIGR02271 family)
MAVVNAIELLAESQEGWEDAARHAVAEATKTLRGITSVYVSEFQATVENDQVKNFRVTVKVSFVLEDSRSGQGPLRAAQPQTSWCRERGAVVRGGYGAACHQAIGRDGAPKRVQPPWQRTVGARRPFSRARRRGSRRCEDAQRIPGGGRASVAAILRPFRAQDRVPGGPPMTRTITAYFDTAEAAQQAAYDLAQRVAGVRGQVYDARTADLDTLSLPLEDAVALREGFRRGGGVVHAEVPDDRFEAVADALEASGAVDLDAREAEWRKEGWAGSTADVAATSSSSTAGATTGASGTTTSTASSSAAGGEVQRLGPAEDEARIPVVEERLRVGKRKVGHGRVRIRSYVVETPVQEQVTLREEHVEVERRPVDRPLASADEATFGERTIEATESAEEATVAKEAHVKEELVVRKTADERTETVSDTVRRTEVEVDDDRATAKGSTDATKRDPGTV